MKRKARRGLGAMLVVAAGLAPITFAFGDYPPPLVRVGTNGGEVLAAERNGRTLYVRSRGSDPSCLGPCALDWPPFLISPRDFPGDGLSVVHRADGGRQWSLGGRPLHFFAGDTARGEARGDGIGRWRALRPKDIGAVARRRSQHERPARDGKPL